MTLNAFLITCEHGGNRVPARYLRLFAGVRDLLGSHRGFDAGALVMARHLARAFDAPLVTSTISRLVVDCNRSIGHPRLCSAAIRSLPAAVRDEIIARYYCPYRERAERFLREAVQGGRRVIHISSHSFTPTLDDKVRIADVGLLYHPGRQGEAALCARWKTSLAALAPTVRVRRNYPYAGKGDGLTAHFRASFPNSKYVGIELEINQRIVFAAGKRWTALRCALIESLRMACATNQTCHPLANTGGK